MRPAVTAVVELQGDRPAAGQRRDVHAVRAALDQQAGDGAHQVGVLPARAGDEPGVARACASATDRSRRALRRLHQREDAARETGQRQRVLRRAAAVDDHGGHRFAGRLRPAAPRSPAAADGPRSRYPSVGQPDATQAESIAACLPEQFIASRSGARPAGEPRGVRRLVMRQGRRAAEVVGAEPDGGEHRGGEVAVAVLAVVRARADRQLRAPSAASSRRPAARSPAPACSTSAAASAGRPHRPRSVTAPAASRTTSDPRCADSRNPDRQTSTRTGLSGQSPGVQCRPSSASSAATSASPSR